MQKKFNNRPILLVDDSDDIRDVFKVWIELEGYTIECTASAGEALEILRQGLNPCLVLADYKMPDMSGAEFIQQARAENLLPHTPVYMFSAHNFTAPVDGAAGLVKKPVDMDQVLTILRNLDQPCSPHSSLQESL